MGLKDGKPGDNGSPDSPLEVKDKLETLEGDDRLDAKHIKNLPESKQTGGRVGWGAHPLVIQDDGVTVAKVARIINFTGGAVTASASGVISVAQGGLPGGSDTQVQFNDSGSFGGDAGFVYNKTTDTATIGQVIDSGLTASRATYSDANKQLASSATTTTELGYVSGVTSAIQTQIDGKQ